MDAASHMTRTEAFALAQRKANDWNTEYRVLRRLDPGPVHHYEVEKSGSEDSPRGYALAGICRPEKIRRYMCERCASTGQQPAGRFDGKVHDAPMVCQLCNGEGYLGEIKPSRGQYD